MRSLLRAAIVGAGLGLATIPVVAHHSFAAEYDSQKPIRLQATTTKMEWTNPHAWLYVDVKGLDGTVKNWKVEFGPSNGLFRRGWRPTDLLPGVALTVDGFLARDNSTTVYATKVTLPDGRTLFAGSPTAGAPGPAGNQ
jgi:hypothetical protein